MTCLTPVGPVQAEASTDEHGRSARMVQPDDTSRTAAGRTADERSAISPTNSSNTRSRARSTAPTARLDHGCRVGRSCRDQCRRSTAAAKPRVPAHSPHRPAEQRASILSPGNVAGKECVLPTIPRGDIGRRCMRLPFEDLGLLRKVMRLDLSPSRISVTVALQDHSSWIGQCPTASRLDRGVRNGIVKRSGCGGSSPGWGSSLSQRRGVVRGGRWWWR